MANGRIDYPEGTEFGDKAVITCDTGLEMNQKTVMFMFREFVFKMKCKEVFLFFNCSH